MISRIGMKLMSDSLDTIGTIARTVADCALFAAAVSGRDLGDPDAKPRPPPGSASAARPPGNRRPRNPSPAGPRRPTDTRRRRRHSHPARASRHFNALVEAHPSS